LSRLDDIAAALERSGHGVALLAAGSVGLETERLDEFSDLDFLAVVEQGYKTPYIDSLAWLEAVYPIAYAHRNTFDGFKVLFADGIFAEFGVLEQRELPNIPYAPVRIVWQTDAFNPALAAGSHLPTSDERLLDWLIGEIMTNLYIGLKRCRRGEKLAALRLVQGFAVDRIIELAEYVESPQISQRDIFAPERRIERRFPGIAARLPDFMQGYERTPESARAILEFVSARFEVNAVMRDAIRALIG
jgi:hypothetical protein